MDDILFLVNRLDNLIASSRKMPLVDQLLVKEADIRSIIHEMRIAIPDEIKQARRIIQDKERILGQAREESERALKREGLLRSAEERSQEILRLADEKAEQIKVEADAYVVETLRALRDHLATIEMDIGRSILSIEKGLASLEEVPEEEDVYEEEEKAEDRQPPSRSSPRRASLAADTMGGPTYQEDSMQGRE